MLGSSSRPFSAIETSHRHSYQFIQQNFRKSHDGFTRLTDDSHVTANNNVFGTQETVNESVVHDRQNETPAENNKISEPEDDEDGMYHIYS